MNRLLLSVLLLTSVASSAQTPCVSIAALGQPCAPATFQLFACTQDAMDAQWTFPGSTLTSQSGLFVNTEYLTAGTYNVSVSMNVGAGTVDTAFTIVVSEAPSICVAAPTVTGCSGQTLCFDATCTNGTGLTYLWEFSDNTSSTLGNPCHDYIDSGCHDIQLTVADFYGCESDTVLQDFACVDPALVACFSSANPPCNCSIPYTVQLQSCSTPSSGVTYQWITPGGTATAPTSSTNDVSYTTTGFYDVSLIASNTSGCSDTMTIADFVCLSSFTPTFDFADTVFHIGVPITFVAGPGFTFNWNVTPATVDTTDNDQTLTVVFNQAGSYQVCLTATFNGCTAEKCTTVVITNPLGIEEAEAFAYAHAFYNAAQKQITLNMLPSHSSLRFELFDVVGSNVMQQNIKSSETRASFNVSALPIGLYGFIISSQSSALTQRGTIMIR